MNIGKLKKMLQKEEARIVDEANRQSSPPEIKGETSFQNSSSLDYRERYGSSRDSDPKDSYYSSKGERNWNQSDYNYSNKRRFNDNRGRGRGSNYRPGPTNRSTRPSGTYEWVAKN